MSKVIIQTTSAPAPIGPYSQAVKTGNLLFVSGQIAMVPSTGELAIANLKEETTQVMNNLKAILLEAGMNFNNIVLIRQTLLNNLD